MRLWLFPALRNCSVPAAHHSRKKARGISAARVETEEFFLELLLFVPIMLFNELFELQFWCGVVRDDLESGQVLGDVAQML